MQPVVINIHIEKFVDKIEAPQGGRASEVEKVFNKIQKEVLSSCLCSVKNYSRAKKLLQELASIANQAIEVIDSGKSNAEICDIAVERIDELTEQISSAILGDCTSINNFNSRI